MGLRHFLGAFAAFATLACLGLFLSATLPVSPVGAQNTTMTVDSSKEIKDLEEKVRLFFEELNTNGTKAFDDLLGTGPLGATSGGENTAGMKAKFDDIKKQFGEFRNYDKIDHKTVGSDLVIVRYLMKCEYHPVVWTFTYYRRPLAIGAVSTMPDTWSLIGLRFDSNLDLLML